MRCTGSQYAADMGRERKSTLWLTRNFIEWGLESPRVLSKKNNNRNLGLGPPTHSNTSVWSFLPCSSRSLHFLLNWKTEIHKHLPATAASNYSKRWKWTWTHTRSQLSSKIIVQILLSISISPISPPLCPVDVKQSISWRFAQGNCNWGCSSRTGCRGDFKKKKTWL